MEEDGIKFTISIPLSISSEYWETILYYRNRNMFFFYLLHKRLLWTSTQDIKIYQKWRQPLDHYIYSMINYVLPMNKFISLVPEITNPSIDLWIICLDDSVGGRFGSYEFDISHIDRVYHVKYLQGYDGRPDTRPDDRYTIEKYELIARMKRIEKPPVYLEMIINMHGNITNIECVLFVTEDSTHFTEVILTGNIQKINNFMIEDEKAENFEIPRLLSINTLKKMCARVVIGQEGYEEIRNNPHLPLTLKKFLLNERPWIMVSIFWKMGVDDMNIRHRHGISHDNIIWCDNFDINNFRENDDLYYKHGLSHFNFSRHRHSLNNCLHNLYLY
ncbi:hypothetical protein TCON_1616 [Astathelohania contejeani]|uniref:LAGLIDADG homing endonuclease n=1 Tax=Astathelohania contejeani TaxID=164912 RepID=A0ABQ7HY94_9MICR|nr:hypothetical protein TCON_1616 [Thelohania contejeani]